ncbi:MAG: response regulator [Prevotellaceae bacterium]|jgi:signal transduction histidine kinase/ligand-binding sensor domain-containing protein/DNA-binding response OmpR family regulator|nr:response regulator [Prevotellaceae bacterium]
MKNKPHKFFPVKMQKHREKVQFLCTLRFCVIFLILLCGRTAQGQIPRYYSTDNGLSNSLINQIFQDSKGFVWIATEWGLNRFDSNKFRIYNNIPNDSNSLPDNYIHTVFESSSHEIYIGAINGLVKYNESGDCFNRVRLLGEDGKPTFSHVTSLSETRNGDVLVATSGQGIFLLKKNEKNAKFNKQLSDLLNSKFVSLLYRDKLQNLWIALETGGLYCYNSAADTMQFFDSQSGLSSNYVSAIAEDNSGNIFIGTLTNGLNIYNTSTKTLKFIPLSDSELLIRSLYFLKNGNLLIGTDGQGLKIYLPANQSISSYDANALQMDLSNGKVHSILQDRDNNLWLGLFQKGVVFLPHASNSFQYWGARQWRNNPIGDGCVMSIFVDSEGVTWVGVDNEGIYGIDHSGGQIAHFTKTASPNSVSNIVVSITEDDEKNLWIGSYTHGLAKVNKKTGYASYIQQLAGQKVYFVTQDRDKNILAATYGAGMFIINPKTNEIKQLESSKTETNNLYTDELFNDWINTILYDSDGYVWLGHYKGLSVYSPQKNTFINFLNKNNLLPNTVVLCLHESRDGQIWIGTTDGLFVFNKKMEKFVHYTVDQGLPNDAICGIEEDRQGNIWISTYHGISKLNVAETHFFNFYVGDGIQGNEFTRGAAFADSNGMLYFGGTNGVTFFDPTRIANKEGTLNLLLTGFYINDAIIPNEKTRNAENQPATSIMNVTRFILESWENSFNMEFSTLDYVNANRIRYQWRIEGQSNEWASTDVGNNKLVFNNSAHGTYKLHVRATDNEMQSEEKVFIIKIAPPWYLSWWAYLFYIVVITAIIFAIYKWYFARLKYQQEILKKENEEAINEGKLQFFINVSHEIRTPMSLIISPLEKLIFQNKDENLQKTYLMIQRNAKRILRLINQLMDVRKIDKGQMKLHYRQTDMVGFIDDLMLTFDYQANNKNIDFQFLHEMEKLPVFIDLNNFDKVLSNLLSNAFKFTQNGGAITLKLTSGNNGNSEIQELKNYFQITVEDTGIGIDKTEVEKIFERFYQVENAQNQANYGTGIGLHLAKSLVELHFGEIFAENREDTRGARFIIRLPLGKEHLQDDDFEEFTQIDKKETPALSKLEPMSYEEAMELDKTLKIKAKTNLKIALIEDDDEIRKYLKSELQRDYRILESNNGKAGYNLIVRELPNLVISDIMMPEMDGITLCRKIKQNANTSHIPVVLLTAKTNIESRLEGLEIGADAYIPKPFNIEELQKTLDNLLKNRKLLKAKFSGAQDQEDKIEQIEKKSADEIFLEKVMRTINEKLDDAKLNVDMLAREVGYSRVHTHRKLKELTGMAARDFIRSIRLKQAANLLQNRDLTISEIAYATGFNNLSHFSNSFKEFFGTTPKEYIQH